MRLLTLFCILCLAAGSLVAGDLTYAISLNTLALESDSAAGPFTIDYQFIDGSGTGDANNTATVNLLTLGGGSLAASPWNVVGDTTGSLQTSVTMTDSSFFNEFDQVFTPGSVLNFLVNVTTNVDAGGTPDTFVFGILDSTGYNLPTTDLGGSFVTINLNSTTAPQVLTYQVSGQTANAGGSALTIAAPAEQVTPEPASVVSMLTGLGLLGLGRKRLFPVRG